MKLLKKSFLLLFIAFICLFSLTGCTDDDMDHITVVVTNYPNEYIMKRLYSKHSKILSIYPDGVDIHQYKLSMKQKREYANKDLFVYNGLIETERELALELLDINPDLKIIDTAYVLEVANFPNELWLNPSSFITMANNVKTGLDEYVSSTYLKKEIADSFEQLKVKLSELDANYRVTVENTNNRTIVVNNKAMKYLEKFGITVLSIDNEASDKTVSVVEEAIQNSKISYIYSFAGDEQSSHTADFLNKYSTVKYVELHSIANLTDEERKNKTGYIHIMENNLELLKQELYQ